MPTKAKTGKIRVEGVAVGVEVHRVEVDDRPDVVAQERQVELESGAEQDPVELVGGAVGEGHRRAVDRCHPRPHRDSALGDERQVLLGEGDTGGEQRRVGCGRAVLLRAATGFDDDLLELPVDLGRWQSLVRQRSVPREDAGVGRHTRGELRQHVPLAALCHHDGRAELSEFGGDLEGADGAARDENTPAEVGKRRRGSGRWRSLRPSRRTCRVRERLV